MRWLTHFYDCRFKWTATAAIGIHPKKVWLSQLVNFKNAIWTWENFRRTICNKICFKLGKMPQKRMEDASDCFSTILHELSISSWVALEIKGRQRVCEGWWEVWEEDKEIRTPELVGQIKSFMNKDRRVSRETIRAQFDVSVGTVRTIIREKLRIRKIFVKFVPSVPREDQKERSCHDCREMVELINSDPAVLNALVTCDESWIQRPRYRVPSGSMLALSNPRRPDRANPPTNFWWSLCLTALTWSTCTGFPLDRQSTRNIMLRF